MVSEDKKKALLEQGYCSFKNVLPQDMLAALREESSRLADARLEEDRTKNRTTGSMIDVTELSLCADLVCLPGALDALKSLGYDNPKFTSGYIISKPPKSPRLFWHYDWACWDDPDAHGPIPQQVFLMYYLGDTSRENGCLRVVPGTHVNENPLHEQLHEAHTDVLLSSEDMSRVEFSDRPDEVDVCVEAGDLVLGDSRLLHATHSNKTEERRTVLTLWYHPDMEALDEGTQGYIANLSSKVPEHWAQVDQERFGAMLARYEGETPALPWNRIRRPKGE